MPVFSVPCPKCKKVLKTSNPIPAGKKVKCPGCQAVFAMPDLEQKGSPVQAKAPPGPSAKAVSPIKAAPVRPAGKKTQLAAPLDDDEGPPRKQKPVVPLDAEDDAPPRKKKAVPIDDDDDEAPPRAKKRRFDDDEDDRPRKGKKRRRDEEEDIEDDDEDLDDYADDDYDEYDRPRKRKKKKAGPPLALILGGAGAAVVVLLVVAAFVWPGFLRSSGGTSGGGGLLALAPADSVVFLRANLTKLRQQPEFKKGFVTGFMSVAQGAPPEIAELLTDVDQALLAGKPAGNTFTFMAGIVMASPYDKEKVKKLLELGNPETIQGHSLYKKMLPNPGMPGMLVSMNDPKMLVVGVVPEADFIRAITATRSSLSAELTSKVNQLDKSAFWVLVANEGFIKQKLLELKGQDLPQAANILPVIQRAKLATLAMDVVDNKDAVVEASLHCSTDADAKEMTKFVETTWQGLQFMIAGFIPKMAGKGPDPMQPVHDTLKTFKVEQQGAQVLASVKLASGIETLTPALMMPGPGNVKAVAAKTQASNNLKQLGLAIHNYHEVHRVLPNNILAKDGKPLLSWRVAILPFIEQDALYKQFDLNNAWNHANNMKLLARMPPVFESPGSPIKNRTYFKGYTGPGTAFENNKLTLTKDFPDGTSNTILLVEAGPPVEWTKPDDIVFNPQGPMFRPNGPTPGGFNVLFVDASARFLRNTVNINALKAAITRNGKEPALPLD